MCATAKRIFARRKSGSKRGEKIYFRCGTAEIAGATLISQGHSRYFSSLIVHVRSFSSKRLSTYPLVGNNKLPFPWRVRNSCPRQWDEIHIVTSGSCHNTTDPTRSIICNETKVLQLGGHFVVPGSPPRRAVDLAVSTKGVAVIV